MAVDYNTGEVPYANQFNYASRRPPGDPVREEPGGGESQTIPGEAMSIKEIMDRAMQGIEIAPSRFEFFDVMELDNIRSFPTDLTDLDATKAELEDIKTSVEEAIAERDAPETTTEPDTTETEPVP